MASIPKYFIGPQLLGDIRRVVGRVDAEPIGSEVTRIPTRLQDMPRAGKVFRICTFTGAWSKNQNKTVTFRGVTATPNTVVAANLFASINTASAPQTSFSCAIAKDGTAWYLISAECFL
jgi:hypothetical protein